MIQEVLPVGEDSAISAETICTMLGIDKRHLRRESQKERLKGAPICASCDGDAGGYYLAANWNEMDHYYRRVARRADVIAEVSDALKHTRDTLFTEGDD